MDGTGFTTMGGCVGKDNWDIFHLYRHLILPSRHHVRVASKYFKFLFCYIPQGGSLQRKGGGDKGEMISIQTIPPE